MSNNRNKLKKRHGPGIWEDEDGALHFSIPELLDMVGLEHTEENWKKVVEMLKEQVKTNNKEAQIVYRSSPDDPGTKL